MNEKISIIVPIYNVEKYLRRCLDSLINQTYSNIEIILVNDGSPDNCTSICEEYYNKDKRIVIVNKENGGLSDARNYGLNKSTGRYILFVDSDDYISFDMITYLAYLIDVHDCDCSCCNYVKTRMDSCDFDCDGEITVFDNGVDACKAMMKKYHFMTTAWAILIKRDIAKKYPFPVGHNQEDEYTTYKYYFSSKRVVVSTRRMYAYFQNDAGIMKTETNKNIVEMKNALIERVEFFKEKNKSLYGTSLVVLSRYILRHVALETIKIDGNLKQYLMNDIHNKEEKIKMKLFIVLYLIFGNVVIKLFKKRFLQ